MANTIPKRSPQTQGLITYLAAATNKLVGPGVKPAGGGWQGAPGTSQFISYLVVHSSPGGIVDGPLGDPHADTEFVWQVDGYGASQLSAEITADLAVTALLVQGLPPIVIAGRTVSRIALDVPGDQARQDPDQPSIWRRFDLFRITTTPA